MAEQIDKKAQARVVGAIVGAILGIVVAFAFGFVEFPAAGSITKGYAMSYLALVQVAFIALMGSWGGWYLGDEVGKQLYK